MKSVAQVAVAVLSVGLAFASVPGLQAADWPAWRYDASRTAASPHGLPIDLQLMWMAEYPAPHRAWMEPLNQQRMPFDQCYEPIVVGKTLFFGSSREDCLVALDTDSGQERWRCPVDGPVRLPAVAWRGKILFACDDGFLYCVSQDSGRLLWRFRGGPSDRKLLGNQRLISAWPARGGPVVVDGTVYFAAGIWPFMGVFIHAIDIDSGEVVWTNDTSGAQFVLQPKRAPSFAGVGPQGSMAVNGDRLIVPGGRTVPAAFNRLTGAFEYFHPEGYREDGAVTHRVPYRRLRYTGSSTVCTSGRFFFCDAYMFNVDTGADLKRLGKERRVLEGDVMYLASNPVQAIDLTTFRPDGPKPERGVQEHTYDTRWTAPFIDNETMIKAGRRLYAAGAGEVAALDPPTAEQPASIAWRARIDGTAASVMAADGKLFVSTTEGRLYCFGSKPDGQVATVVPQPPEVGLPDVADADAVAILKSTRIWAGHCVLLGTRNAGMILTLALKTDLRIHVIDSNRAHVMKLHARLNRARLLPPQICTLTARPYSGDLPPYLASLLVCSPVDDDGHFPDETGQWLRSVFRYLRPYGGTACLRTSQSQFETLQRLVESTVLANASLRYVDGFSLLTRGGPLPGAGSWTHNYADAGNTTVSTDSRVRLPLGVLWFGGSSHDATLPRHGRPPAPQALDGRIIVEGLDGLRAMDAFTGRVMWDAKLPGLGRFFNTVIHQPGALAVGGNYVTTHDGIYVAIGDRCVRLDPSNGQTMAEYQLPPGTNENDRPTWGYINGFFTEFSGQYPVEVSAFHRRRGCVFCSCRSYEIHGLRI